MGVTFNPKEARFVVVGIRHFTNGEHHWIAPDIHDEKDRNVADAFAEEGSMYVNEYYKPVYTALSDAERFAMSKVLGEITLSQWEERRPTMYVLEEVHYRDIMEKDDYPLPDDSEEWSDAKTADFERECDCEDIKNLAVWNSDSDDETISEQVIRIVYAINFNMENVTAWVEDGLVALHYEGKQNKECCADFIESLYGFPKGSLEWVRSDEPNGVAYYEVK